MNNANTVPNLQAELEAARASAAIVAKANLRVERAEAALATEQTRLAALDADAIRERQSAEAEAARRAPLEARYQELLRERVVARRQFDDRLVALLDGLRAVAQVGHELQRVSGALGAAGVRDYVVGEVFRIQNAISWQLAGAGLPQEYVHTTNQRFLSDAPSGLSAVEPDAT